jgi:hypothetical protein
MIAIDGVAERANVLMVLWLVYSMTVRLVEEEDVVIEEIIRDEMRAEFVLMMRQLLLIY